MSLVERLENAPAEKQAYWVGVCVEYAYSQGWINGAQTDAAQAMIRVGAYESAALILVPENVLSWKISDTPGGPHAWLYDGEREYDGYPNPGCGTPALAICIACLKARAALDEKERTDGQ